MPDPYRWLEAADDPATRKWSADQQALWQEVRGSLPGLAGWHALVTRLADAPAASAPLWRGDVRYTVEYRPGSPRPSLVVADADGTRDVLSALPADLTRGTSLQTWKPSTDGRLLALTHLSRDSGEGRLVVVDVASGAVADGPLLGCAASSIGWIDERTFFYVRRPGTGRSPGEVVRHTVGQPWSDDVPVFGTLDDPVLYYSLTASPDGRWLVISRSDGSPASGNELVVLAVAEVADVAQVAEPTTIQGAHGANTGVTFGTGGRMLLLTNDGAPNWRLMTCRPDDPARDRWVELIPESPDLVLVNFAPLDRDTLLVVRQRNAVSELAEYAIGAREWRDPVDLPGLGTIRAVTTSRARPGRAWVSYTDFVTPATVFEQTSGARRLSGTGTGRAAATSTAVSSILHCRSADGAPLQMTVVRLAGLDLPAPTVLCGYGGFGTSYVPHYSASTDAWVRAGGVFVVANVRGGSERGNDWHEAGRGRRKQNSIDDFLACARAVVEAGLTTRDQLAMWGESNGALLVCAALTQAPELFAAAVASSPLCDMVRYELSGAGAAWRSEYGSVDDPLDFASLVGYSPYHRVRHGCAYPATLLAVTEADDRVDGMHARKMCAALQHASVGDGPIVLRREQGFGHSLRSLTDEVGLIGDSLGFMAAATGLALPGPAGL